MGPRPLPPVWRTDLSLAETAPHGSQDFLSLGPTFHASSVKVSWRTIDQSLHHLWGRKVGRGWLVLPLDGTYRHSSGTGPGHGSVAAGPELGKSTSCLSWPIPFPGHLQTPQYTLPPAPVA